MSFPIHKASYLLGLASIQLSQLPPAFAQDLRQWSARSAIAPITTRYFITGSNKKILLEHDEEYCAPGLDDRGARPDRLDSSPRKYL